MPDEHRGRIVPSSRGPVSRIGVDARRSPSSAPEAEEAGLPLTRYWQIIRARGLLVLGVVLLVVGATAAGTLMKEPVYRASGMIELRQPGDDLVPMEALFQSPNISDQHLETQYALLKSPALARRVADEVLVRGGLNTTSPAEVRPAANSEEDPVPSAASSNAEADMRTATRWVQEGLSIDPVRGSRLVRVAFEASNADLAADVVNAVFRHFSSLRVDAARSAVQRLAAQGDTVRLRLAEAERQLQDYVRENDLFFLESGAGGDSENILHDRLQRLQQELTLAEAERYQKEALHNLLLEGELDYLDSGVLESLNVRLADLRSEYARLTSIFTDDYPRTLQVKNQLDELEARLGQERGRVGSQIRNDYRAALDRERLVREAFESQKRRIDELAGTTADYHVLRREVAGHLDLYADLQQKRKEAEVSAAAATTEISVVEAALAPELPVRPLPKRDLPLALLVGLVLGVGVAFLREYTDTVVHTAEELHAVSAIPVLGVIPSSSVNGWDASIDGVGKGETTRRRALRPFRRSRTDDHRLLSEAVGGLRTSVLFDIEGRVPRSLLVTSSQPAEGKTTISVNLALSLAKLDRRILLIDADTRRPAVHRALEIGAGPGLTDHLERRRHWREVVECQVAPGLDVLTAGPRPHSPSDLLSSPRMQEVLEEAEVEYDFVIIDSPALLINAADTRTLAPLVDGVLLVVRSGVTSRGTVRHVLGHTPNVIGVVLNDLDVRKFAASYGAYGGDAPEEVTEVRTGARDVSSDESRTG